jgi:hypothetical protein
MLRLRSPGRPWRPVVALSVAGLVVAATAAPAQRRWTVDPKTSIAWWQMSPHLNHLWATTCPGDPSWRPGESRSSGWKISPELKLPWSRYGNVDDTVHVPLFPRHIVQSDCIEAVRGEIVAPDTVHWRGTHGTVTVEGDALITGQAMRDVMMHQVLETAKYPEIQFALDSLVGMTRQGDTLTGSAVGILTIRNVPESVVAVVKAFPDSGGLRVLAKWHFPAPLLFIEVMPALHYLGLGANTYLWHEFFMGADLVLRPGTVAAH